MSDIPAALDYGVRLRAGGRCEYCGLSQLGQEAVFHIDHIVPRLADGPTVSENLALACVSCSLRKGARRSAPDPETGNDEPMFHPRTHRWGDHFPVGRRAGRGAHPDRPCDDGGARDEPPHHSRHSAGRNSPGPAPAGRIVSRRRRRRG